MRKSLCILTVAALILSLLAGCGGGEPGANGNGWNNNPLSPGGNSTDSATDPSANPGDDTTSPETQKTTENEPATEDAIVIDTSALGPEIPENTPYTVHCEDANEDMSFFFTPTETGSYSLFLDAYAWASVSVVFDNDGRCSSIISGSVGPGCFKYSTEDNMRYIPMEKGRVYQVEFGWKETGDHTVQIESFANQVRRAEDNDAPLITTTEKVRVESDGTFFSGVARFIPEKTGDYEIDAGRGYYKILVGEEGVFFDDGHQDNDSVDAELLAGHTYLLYIYTVNRTPCSAEVIARPVAQKEFTPVTYRAEDLANGPLRYTVIILQDNDILEDLWIENEQKTATSLCETLLGGPGTDYIAVVDMYQSNLILWDNMNDHRNDVYPWTEEIFTSDAEKLRTYFSWLSGSAENKCNIGGAINRAGQLLDAARATYGDAVETSIVLYTGADAAEGWSMYPGYYSNDPDSNGTWALQGCCNGVYWTANFEKAKGHKIYTVNFDHRGAYAFDMFYPLEEKENAFLNRFVKDISSGDGYCYAVEEPGEMAGTVEAIAKKILGQ